MTLDQKIYLLEKLDKITLGADCDVLQEETHRLLGWLKELRRYRFEISECKAILDNPTPDVTENDRKRAMYVLQTFPDVRGDDK